MSRVAPSWTVLGMRRPSPRHAMHQGIHYPTHSFLLPKKINIFLSAFPTGNRNRAYTALTQNYSSGASNRLNVSSLSYEEKASIETACIVDKSNGPASYNRCLASQLAEMKNAPRRPDLSGLSYEEKASIETACIVDKSNGPASYNTCLVRQLSGR
jgi:hypothetical protein